MGWISSLRTVQNHLEGDTMSVFQKIHIFEHSGHEVNIVSWEYFPA